MTDVNSPVKTPGNLSVRKSSLQNSAWKSLSRFWLCDPMAYTVHGILQARILEWVAFPFSRGSSQPRNQTGVCCTAGGFSTNWAIGEALNTSLFQFSSPVRISSEGCGWWAEGRHGETHTHMLPRAVGKLAAAPPPALGPGQQRRGSRASSHL